MPDKTCVRFFQRQDLLDAVAHLRRQAEKPHNQASLRAVEMILSQQPEDAEFTPGLVAILFAALFNHGFVEGARMSEGKPRIILPSPAWGSKKSDLA